jgi:hypothetical protein
MFDNFPPATCLMPPLISDKRVSMYLFALGPYAFLIAFFTDASSPLSDLVL